MADNENIEISFRLEGIELLGKRIADRRDNKIFKHTDFHFVINTTIKVNKDARIILVVIDVNLSEVANKTIELAYMKVGCAFEIQNFDQVVVKQSGSDTYNINPMLEGLVRSLTIGTCRGLLFSELTGTYLNKALLPIVNIDVPITPPISDRS